MKLSRTRIMRALLAIGLAASPLMTAAQVPASTDTAYPQRPVRLIVPFPAGGLVDGVARTLTPDLSKSIGQPIVVENRGGAGGTVGAAAAAQAASDGYTLLMVLDTHATNPLVYRKLPYDAQKAFAPISLIARAPMVAVANEKLPVNDIKGLVRYAKANPSVLNFGSVGAGSASHLTAEMFNHAAGVSMVHVPYRGGAPAQADLMGGQIQLMWGTAPYATSLIKAGNVKALGQASAARSPAFPDLPTLAEQGLPGLEIYGWVGLLAPTGTPEPIIAQWSGLLARVLKDPEVARRLGAQGFEVVASSPERFAAFIQDEQKRWAKLIDERRIPLE